MSLVKLNRQHIEIVRLRLVAYTISLMYIKNKRGPNIEPRCTPVVMSDVSNDVPSISAYCVLLVK